MKLETLPFKKWGRAYETRLSTIENLEKKLKLQLFILFF